MEHLAKNAPFPRDFLGAFRKGRLALIAEIKKASPSKGVIRKDLDPAALAKEYEKAGASAISVLTDKKFFKGSLDHLRSARRATSLPVLRKDFIVDASQVYQSRIIGADAILLIVRALSIEDLGHLIDLADQLGLASLVEAHSKEEAEAAYLAGAKIIGINNRDLSNFSLDLDLTGEILRALPKLKERIVVSESGIEDGRDAKRLFEAGVDAVLVGESILKSDDAGAKIKELLNRD
jgi:indole-3-glycerol phosphate synthase